MRLSRCKDPWVWGREEMVCGGIGLEGGGGLIV